MKKWIKISATLLIALIITIICSFHYSYYFYMKSDEVISFDMESMPTNIVINGYETNENKLICTTEDSWIDIPLNGVKINYVEIDSPEKVESPVPVQVYYKINSEYSETNSTKYTIHTNKKNRIYIPDNQYNGVRLDIGNKNGDKLTIGKITVGNESMDYIQKVGTLKLIITMGIVSIILFGLQHTIKLMQDAKMIQSAPLTIFNKYKKRVWYAIMWIGIAYYIYMGIKTRGYAILNTLHNYAGDTFMDFFNSMMYERHPYESKVIYPPIANLIYYFFYLFVPSDIFVAGSFAIRDSQIGRVLIAMYISLTTLGFLYAILKLKKGIIEEKILFGVTLICSMPFLYQLERANMIFVSLFFLMIYIYGYNSEKEIVKHIAFISLAVSASIKIYPALFGLILIRDKRWKDALICCMYGIIIFLAPFMFFGGIKNVGLMIANILNCTADMNNTGEGLKLNISNIFNYLGIIVCNDKSAFDVVTIIMKVFCLFGGTCLILFGEFKQKWKLYMVPTLMMILIPDFSFLYAMTFICIPLIYFLDNKETNCRIDIIYFILFVLMLIPIVNTENPLLDSFKNDYYPLTMSVIIESMATFIFMIILWGEGIYSIIQKRVKGEQVVEMKTLDLDNIK